MENKNILIILAIAVILIGGFLAWSFLGDSKEEKSTNSGENIKTTVGENDIVYYYGQECPHCKEVFEFMEKNNIMEKVDMQKKEIWHNTDNSKEMMTLATQRCGLNKNEVGVPFLYAEGKCYIGSPEVKRVLGEKAGI